MSAPFSEAAGIPVNEPVPVSTFSPVALPVPGRAVDLQIKVSAPATGDSPWAEATVALENLPNPLGKVEST